MMTMNVHTSKLMWLPSPLWQVLCDPHTKITWCVGWWSGGCSRTCFSVSSTQQVAGTAATALDKPSMITDQPMVPKCNLTRWCRSALVRPSPATLSSQRSSNHQCLNVAAASQPRLPCRPFRTGGKCHPSKRTVPHRWKDAVPFKQTAVNSPSQQRVAKKRLQVHSLICASKHLC